MRSILINKAFSNSPIACSFHDAIYNEEGVPYDFKITSMNKACEETLEINASDVENKRLSEFCLAGWENPRKWKELFQESILNKKIFSHDMYNQSKNKWVRVTFFPISDAEITCLYNEVTKEYILEDMVELNPDIYCLLDTEGNVLLIDPQVSSLLGYQPFEIEGNSFYSLIHPTDLSDTIQTIEKVKNNGMVIYYVNRIKDKNGDYKYFEWHFHKKDKQIFSYARDITNKRKAEIKIAEMIEELQKEKEKLSELAVIDELTGANNRHFVNQWIHKEMARADRYRKPISLVILDMDYFKHVNDKFGHPIGDEVLKKTAKLIKKIIRKSDIFVRMGGEEFAIFLPETNNEGAKAVAEKIRKKIESTDFDIALNITASFGVAEREKHEPFITWYKRADDALYHAKESGRNQVFCANEEKPLPIASVRIDWKPEWESGHEIIVQQHKEMVQIGNRLIYLSLTNASEEEILKQLDLVLEHVETHFDYEVKVLREIGFPGSEEHDDIHNDLIEKTVALKQDYLDGKLKASAFFSYIVDDIIIGHMIEEDSKFFEYTRKIFQSNYVTNQSGF